MKLLYIANLRLPTEKAYGVQIAKMCEAFANSDANDANFMRIMRIADKVEVELVAPYRKNNIKDGFFDYYGIKKDFKFKKIWAPDFYWPGKLDKIAVNIKSFISALMLCFYAFTLEADMIYSRDEWPLYFLSFFRKNLVFEAHRFSNTRKFFYRKFKNKNIKVVVITKRLKEDFIKIGFKPEKILVAPDGVDLKEFALTISKEEAREKTNLPLDKNMIMYTGHLFEWKGADTLLEAAKLIANPGILFVFVGGTDYDIEKFRKKADGLGNVLILGHRPYSGIPLFLKAADILVLPNSAKVEISRSYTSPLKLFEYMASGRPIVATNLPSLREILNDSNAVLVKANSGEALASGIKKLITHPEIADKLATKAFDDVQKYTWANRVKLILDFVK